jgi:ankyrin repeat protein
LQFRYRGSRRESAVAQLFSLGRLHIIKHHMNIKTWIAILFATGALTLSCFASYDEIHQAALDGDLDKVKVLLKANPDLVFSKVSTNDTYYARYGYTPLECAAEKGHKDVVEYLLANKADVNAKSDNGWTALHAAAYHGHKDVVEVLLSNKADIGAKDLDGYTPLHLAAGGGHKDIVELLLANKADVNAKSVNGQTPLKLAELVKHTDVVDLLRQNGGHE